MTTLHESAAALRAHDPLAILSTLERQVFDLVADGVPRAEIARRLNLPVRTIHYQRARVLRQLGLKSNAEIIRLRDRAALELAKDHALIAAALTAGVAAWKPFELAGVGEVAVAGLRHAVHLDASGVPELHDYLRRALTAALEWERSHKRSAA